MHPTALTRASQQTDADLMFLVLLDEGYRRIEHVSNGNRDFCCESSTSGAYFERGPPHSSKCYPKCTVNGVNCLKYEGNEAEIDLAFIGKVKKLKSELEMNGVRQTENWFFSLNQKE
nr:hypothetical transcript [Hymenolepis microstoma]